ncbi:unnamed protein product [Effrenium voratum]|nr:unnamed protein product [Effrenium voratum]
MLVGCVLFFGTPFFGCFQGASAGEPKPCLGVPKNDTKPQAQRETQADEANAKSQTPSMDVDPAVKMPEAPVHAYSYFSDTRMLRRLAYCSSGPRLTTLPESGV